MNRNLLTAAMFAASFVWNTVAFAVEGVRLIGITGNQGLENDETLYEIDIDSQTISPLLKLPFIPDTDAIAFNSQNGLLYRTSGASSYSNNPTSNGYRDNHFLQSIDVVGGSLDQVAIFNANSQQFGPAAPRPSWVLPTERRTDEQTDGSFRVQGPNEYHSLRDFTWSSSECLFYGSDEDGIYKLTTDGESTLVGSPGGQPKGITFANVGDGRLLLLADRDSAELWTIDPTTGQHAGPPVMVKHPTTPDAFVSGLLSLVEIPGEELLYAIMKVPGSPQDRRLIMVDPITGDSFDVMPLGTYMADLALVYNPPVAGDLTEDGRVDREDAALFAHYFGTQVSATWGTGDFDCDGKATLADLAMLQANLVTVPGASTAVSSVIPEPASATLLGIGAALAALIGVKRRAILA